MRFKLRSLALVTVFLVLGALLWRSRATVRDPRAREFAAADTELEEGRLDGGVQRLQDLIVKDPAYGPAYAALGNGFLLQGDYGRAAQALESALFLVPQQPHLYCRLADAYVHLRDREEAVRTIKTALEREPTCPYAHLVAGEQWLRDDDLTHSVAEFQTAIRLSPDAPIAYQRAGYVLLDMGRSADAEKVLVQGLKLAPNRPDFHVQLGRLYAKRAGDPDALAKADDHYRKALAGNPHGEGILAALGNVAQLRGRTEEARKYWEDALKQNRNEAQALYGLSQLATAAGQTATAQLYLERFHRIQKLQEEMDGLRTRAAGAGDRKSRLRLAKLALDAGITEEAERQLSALVRDSPEDTEIRNLQGRLLLLEGRGDEAQAEFRLAGSMSNEGTSH